MNITDEIRDKWIDNVKPANGFLRNGSVKIYRSVEGTGIAPGIDAYPHQHLDINTYSYTYPWLEKARTSAQVGQILGPVPGAIRAAGNLKHPGITPLGTSVATLAREGHDMLTSDCGNCGRSISKCSGDCSG